jgi:hypothetical protein
VQVFSSVSFQFSAAIDAILKFGVWKKDGAFSPQFSKSQEVSSLFFLFVSFQSSPPKQIAFSDETGERSFK